METANFFHSKVRRTQLHLVHAFTLIEVMVVVGVIAVLLALGIPPFVKALKSQGMRKAVNDVVDVCRNARARAIFSGTQTEVVFHPLEKRFEARSGVSATPSDTGEATTIEKSSASDGLDSAGQLPEEITIEMLDINLLEYRESEVARVRFYPNGTSDEMTLILRSDKNEFRKIWLEVTTGLADWGGVQ